MQKDLPLLNIEEAGALPLFMPYVTDAIRSAVAEQLTTRWVGQGPGVDRFEGRFRERVLQGGGSAVAVSSGTAALHLSYRCALEMKQMPGTDTVGEVIAPVFTCTATNLPWLYLGQRIRWADVELDSMNISPASVAELIGPQTRAVSVVHYGGYPAKMDEIRAVASEYNVPVIEDAAQALGGKAGGVPMGLAGDFGAFSFQAIKHITTGDGGMLTTKHTELEDKLRRLRWFGIDRKGKQSGTWENDIDEVGFKYQMTDIAAAMGSAGLADLDPILEHRRSLLSRYAENLADAEGTRVLASNGERAGDEHGAWLATVVIDGDSNAVRARLRESKIEANPVHFRNDRYSVFRGVATGECPNMDQLEGSYLCLPLHMGVSLSDVDRICDVLVSG